MSIYATLFAIAFLLTFLLTPVVRQLACRAGFFDVPDGRRKIHSSPIPRLGGLAVAVAVYASLFLTLHLTPDAAPSGTLTLALGMLAPALMVLGVGVLDDLKPVNPSVKLAVQIAAGLWVYYVLDIRIHLLANPLGGESTLGALSLPVTLLWIVLVTNAFNIVDGMDGLATGVALIAATCMFLVSLHLQNVAIALLTAPLAGAALGFLRYNFNPASIFLGDSGSLFLGFQLAVLSIAGSQKSSTAIAIVTPVLMLAFPLIETAISVARRFLRGEPIMRPDRGHIHHQLLRRGLTPRRAVLLLYLGSAVFGLTSLFLVQKGTPVIGMTAVALAAATWVGLRWLGYAEFGEINDAFKRAFLYQRRVIRHNLQIRTLAEDLRGAVSLDVASERLAAVARRLGFSHAMLWYGRSDVAPMALRRRAAVASLPDLSRHTVMSVRLAGRTGELGEVVLARPRNAEPLQSELPVFIDAITSTLPAIIERAIADLDDPMRSMMVVPLDSRRGSRDRAVASPERSPFGRPFPARPFQVMTGPVARELSSRQPCTQCGEFALVRSRSRSTAERIRKLLSGRRLHRCTACGWRGWEFVLVHLEPERPARPSLPDLGTIEHGPAHSPALHAAL